MSKSNLIVILMNALIAAGFTPSQIADGALDFTDGSFVDGVPQYYAVTLTRKPTKSVTRKDGKTIAAYDHEAAVAAYEAKLVGKSEKPQSKAAQAKAAKEAVDKAAYEAALAVLSDTPRTADEIRLECSIPDLSRQKVTRLMTLAVSEGAAQKVEKEKHVAYIAAK